MSLSAPDVLIDPSSFQPGKDISVEAGGFGKQAGAGEEAGAGGRFILLELASAARWLTHPMGAMPVLDLSRGHLAVIDAAEGAQLLVTDQVTLFVWIEWRPANVPARVTWRGAGEVPIAVEEGSRRLGVYVEQQVAGEVGTGGGRKHDARAAEETERESEGGLREPGSGSEGESGAVSGEGKGGAAFRRSSARKRALAGGAGVRFIGCGYNISVAGWQLVAVVRRVVEVDAVPSAAAGRGAAEQQLVESVFFVNGYRVGVTRHTLVAPASASAPHTLKLSQLGHGKMGPGFVGLAGIWERALSEDEVRSLWLVSRARFGLHVTQEDKDRSSSGAGSVDGKAGSERRWTLAMTSAPEQFKDRGALWYMAHMLQFVMRPNLHLQRLVLAAKRAVRWVSPAMGVHIRRGDACEKGHERLCVGAGELLPDIRRIYSRYALRGVYLATDSANVVRELKAAAPEVNWMVLEPLDRVQLDPAVGFGNLPRMLQMRLGLYDRRALAESAFCDLLLLAQTDALAGQFSSHFFKTAFALAVAEKGFVPPYVGWDGPPSW